MNLTRVLYSSLAGAISVIILLLSAWGKDTTQRITVTQAKVEILEQSRATHDAELKQIHQDLEEIKEILRANGK